eukprot:TRINITY_DN1020_c0_g2_i2.p1 TRINITY_DN1020_c0_g2~~TRINITY_DN1020_c0_g2_i2.p1  ORF type:complete len:179 (-),score=35.84 TRINITY_DN1020_c0_g2_i2:538-1074(-)
MEEELSVLLNVDKDQILNIYLHGSRLFGTNTPQSDYDYVAVLSGHIGPLSNPENAESIFPNDELLFQSENFDVTLMEYNHWKHLIKSHSIQYLYCHFDKKENKIKETCPVSLSPSSINILKLKHNIYGYTKRHITKSLDDWRRVIQFNICIVISIRKRTRLKKLVQYHYHRHQSTFSS